MPDKNVTGTTDLVSAPTCVLTSSQQSRSILETVPVDPGWGYIVFPKVEAGKVDGDENVGVIDDKCVMLTEEQVNLGRSSSCQVRVEGAGVSKVHCRLQISYSATAQPDSKNNCGDTNVATVMLTDLSLNGTWVNGKCVGKNNFVQLLDNSRISLGGAFKPAYRFHLKPLEEGPGSCVDYRILPSRLLGQGGFSKVYVCIHRESGEERAVKILDKRHFSDKHPSARPEAIMDEVHILRAVSHPSVVRVHHVRDTPSTLYLYLELVKGGDLLGYIHALAGHGMSEPIARTIFGQLLAAVRALHKRGIAHRDIKPENVLLCEPPSSFQCSSRTCGCTPTSYDFPSFSSSLSSSLDPLKLFGPGGGFLDEDQCFEHKEAPAAAASALASTVPPVLSPAAAAASAASSSSTVSPPVLSPAAAVSAASTVSPPAPVPSDTPVSPPPPPPATSSKPAPKDDAAMAAAWRVKLTDFGLSRLIGERGLMTSLVGTPHYVAPEVANGEPYDERVDSWGMGVVLYVMLYARLPFQHSDPFELLQQVRAGGFDLPSRLPCGALASVSSEAQDLMQKLLRTNPADRIALEDVGKHPWITCDTLPKLPPEGPDTLPKPPEVAAPRKRTALAECRASKVRKTHTV